MHTKWVMRLGKQARGLHTVPPPWMRPQDYLLVGFIIGFVMGCGTKKEGGYSNQVSQKDSA